MDNLSRSRARRVCGTGATLAAFLLAGQVAEAGSHRARLSKDLEARLAAGDRKTTSVIVSGSAADVQTLVARHGVRWKKSVRGGAVLEVTGGQLAALAEDPAVTHVSSDTRVERMMAVTAESTGATQIWNGLDGLPGFTGRGIGVAVIDSGVAPHRALRSQVIAAFDFTGTADTANDKFGQARTSRASLPGARNAGTPASLPARTSSACACLARTDRATPAT